MAKMKRLLKHTGLLLLIGLILLLVLGYTFRRAILWVIVFLILRRLFFGSKEERKLKRQGRKARKREQWYNQGYYGSNYNPNDVYGYDGYDGYDDYYDPY